MPPAPPIAHDGDAAVVIPHSPVQGLRYPPGFIESLDVLQHRPAPHTPIYALSAAQYAALKYEYSLADVNDSVLFPFLHGLEGDNLAQNMFFAPARGRQQHDLGHHAGPHAAAHNPNGGIPSMAGAAGPAPLIPRYRGLTSVACPARPDDDTIAQGSDGSSTSLSGMDTDSPTSSSPGSSAASDVDQLAFDESTNNNNNNNNNEANTTTTSTDITPASASTASASTLPVPVPSHGHGAHMHPQAHRRERDSSFSSSNNSHLSHSHSSSDWGNQQRQHSSSFSSTTTSSSSPLSASTTATSLWAESSSFAAANTCEDDRSSATPPPSQMLAGGARSKLLSSVLPHEVLCESGARFVKPHIPDGISL
ncbi:hypothetical protein DL93DRAFT_2167787 [Clavulina sp. PMI_390]|nr:hypothetical protein DL93DRAFT_2167787 [Clavulina sp. PMI_390]